MMISRILLAVGATLIASGAMANLLTNGSFEANSVVSNGGADDRPDSWSNFTDVGAGSPDVWDNAGVDGLAPGYLGFFTHLTAYDGTNMVSIAATTSLYTEGIESTAVALTAGATYRVSIRTAYDSHNSLPWNNPASLRVRLRPAAAASSILVDFAAHTTDHAWEYHSYDFQVLSTGSYSVIFSAEDYSSENFFVIDDAQLVEIVPEPATIAGLAVASAALLRRRRKP